MSNNLKITFDDGLQKVFIDIIEENGKSSVEINFEPELNTDSQAGSAVSLSSQFFNWLVEE